MSAKDVIAVLGPERIAAENAIFDNPDSAIHRVVPRERIQLARVSPPTRDELRAKEWAEIAVQYHQKTAARGFGPFPDLCFCHGVAPHDHDPTGLNPCPVISAKTRAARVKAIGEAIGATDGH